MDKAPHLGIEACISGLTFQKFHQPTRRDIGDNRLAGADDRSILELDAGRLAAVTDHPRHRLAAMDGTTRCFDLRH